MAKVGDYGLAKAFDAAGLSGQTRTGSMAGTPHFMPRQQVVNFKYARPEVDVWAMAASLYNILAGWPSHLQVERQDSLSVFKFTDAAQERLEDLLTRRQDVGLSAEEQAELDALAELDRIFTYSNAQLTLTQGYVPGQ
jgi:serine/threonine protein kinase